jgi:hypothetical protein
MLKILKEVKLSTDAYYCCRPIENIKKAVSHYQKGSFIDMLERVQKIPSYRDLYETYWIGEMISKEGLYKEYPGKISQIIPTGISHLSNFTSPFFKDLIKLSTWLDLGVRKNGKNVTFYKGLYLENGKLKAQESLETSLKDINGQDRMLNWNSFWGYEKLKQKEMTEFVLDVNQDEQKCIFEIVHGHNNSTYSLWPNIEIPEDSKDIKVYQLSHRFQIGQIMLPMSCDYADLFSGTFKVKKSDLLSEIASEMRENYLEYFETRTAENVEGLRQMFMCEETV